MGRGGIGEEGNHVLNPEVHRLGREVGKGDGRSVEKDTLRMTRRNLEYVNWV